MLEESDYEPIFEMADSVASLEERERRRRPGLIHVHLEVEVRVVKRNTCGYGAVVQDNLVLLPIGIHVLEVLLLYRDMRGIASVIRVL